MNINSVIFEPTNQAIIDDIKQGLKDQGHYLTGALENSLKEYIIETENGFELTAAALDYMEDLENGIPADKININAKLDEMTRYVEKRMGYGGSYAVKVAHRILKKQAVEGMPTKASYKYSKTGERKDVVRLTFQENNDKYGQMIDTNVASVLDAEFSTIQSQTF